MSDDKIYPANIDAETRKDQLCIPPPGRFDATCSLLKWVSRIYNKRRNSIYRSVYIPTARVGDFKAGEAERGQCSFYTPRTKEPKNSAKDPDQEESAAQRVRMKS